MLTSVGDDTPLGTFYTPEKYRWRLMVNDTYTQYATRLTAGQGFLFHSITYASPVSYTHLDVYKRQEEEHEILESGAELACDVLKLGHHGSSNASSYRFLRETNPEAVVISCGYDNSYGHPHRETLERIEDLGAALYRTDTQGTIAVFSDGEHLEFCLLYTSRCV